MSPSKHRPLSGGIPHRGEAGVHDGTGFIDFPIVTGASQDLGSVALSHATAALIENRQPSTSERKKPVNLERLRVVVELLGFVPTDKEEITLSIAKAKEPLGFARYLNQVLGHQQYKTSSETPVAALIAKVEQAASYARNARGSVGLLIAFKDDLSTRSNLNYLVDWSKQGPTSRALREIARSEATHMALELNEEIKLEDLPLDTIASTIIELGDVGGLGASLDRTIGEQQTRFDYWRTCLHDACAHEAVADLAATRLKEFGIATVES